MKRVENITYSLRGNRRNSNRYHEAITTFTDKVLTNAQGIQLLIEGFQAFIKKTHYDTQLVSVKHTPRHRFNERTISTPENTLQLSRGG